ncbi:DNA repair protein RecO [Kineothrix sp. MB12-C1]|uniref:DNA repair protein RecO n=1 Tax=Kineothrix sp. MB12-C1 TaxID=3070215 RepID=UPI0027D33226|nr:DNA repair protein RecO [Kineothrix sp. MB12-C1]WMC92397.1 DNA repair protein RecO [Kineothrix sp. MB12-C1]
MQEFVKLTGMVLKTVPIGEYDRRVVILTKERGKVPAFAKGARKPNSRLVAAAAPFSFGEFKMYEGRSSYNIMEADISNYFESLREDFEAACYGMYFLEVMDYYTRENNDEKEMLKLLYQSLRALQLPSLHKNLVRYIFEIKALILSGEYPGIPGKENLKESTVYTMSYIEHSSVEKLYTFTVTEEVLKELRSIADNFRRKYMDKEFKSLTILADMSL